MTDLEYALEALLRGRTACEILVALSNVFADKSEACANPSIARVWEDRSAELNHIATTLLFTD